MTYKADVFLKTFGPRVVLEGEGKPSEALIKRAATPAANSPIVDLVEALADEDDAAEFDSEKNLITKVFART